MDVVFIILYVWCFCGTLMFIAVYDKYWKPKQLMVITIVCGPLTILAVTVFCVACLLYRFGNGIRQRIWDWASK